MKKLFENTFVELDRGVRMFLLTGTEKALMIDTGMSGADVRAMISAHTSLPCELLNTHADRDHTSSNSQFDTFYMHASETAFYRNSNGNKGNIAPVFEGDTLDLGGRVLEIIHLPGHTPGSITVLDKNSRCLFGGDPIQRNGNIFMFGPQREMTAYIASLKRLLKRDDFDFIYPSHGDEKVSRDVIPALIDGAEKILARKIRGEEKEFFGKKAVVYDAGVSRFLCDPDK